MFIINAKMDTLSKEALLKTIKVGGMINAFSECEGLTVWYNAAELFTSKSFTEAIQFRLTITEIIDQGTYVSILEGDYVIINFEIV